MNETPCQCWQKKCCSCRTGTGGWGAAPAFALLCSVQSFPLVMLVFSLCINCLTSEWGPAVHLGFSHLKMIVGFSSCCRFSQVTWRLKCLPSISKSKLFLLPVEMINNMSCIFKCNACLPHVRARHGDFPVEKETRSSTHGIIIYSLFITVYSEHFNQLQVAFDNLKGSQV